MEDQPPLWPYERVLNDLRGKIKSGALSGKLPTRMDLSEQYKVAAMTIQRAINELKAEGLVVSRPGLAVQVVPPGKRRRAARSARDGPR